MNHFGNQDRLQINCLWNEDNLVIEFMNSEGK